MGRFNINLTWYLQRQDGKAFILLGTHLGVDSITFMSETLN